MGVHTFPKGICPKVNVIGRLEYELAYYDPAVHRFNHYTTRTPPSFFFFNKVMWIYIYIFFIFYSASGDLKRFHEGQDPFDAKHGYDCNLFTSETRPQCVKDLYSSAEISPSVGLSSLDGIRKDGWSGSTMFKLWPVVIKDINISTPDFNMSRKVR